MEFNIDVPEQLILSYNDAYSLREVVNRIRPDKITDQRKRNMIIEILDDIDYNETTRTRVIQKLGYLMSKTPLNEYKKKEIQALIQISRLQSSLMSKQREQLLLVLNDIY